MNKQMRKMHKGYKKLLEFWQRSNNPAKWEYIEALTQSIEELEEQFYEESLTEWEMV